MAISQMDDILPGRFSPDLPQPYHPNQSPARGCLRAFSTLHLLAVSHLMGPAEINAAIAALAAEIIRKRPRGHFSLVGIRSRGDEVAERLQKSLAEAGRSGIELGVLDISLYRDDFSHRRENPTLQSTEIPFSIDGSHIILCDDVLFTGRTIRAALDALSDYGRPSRIELACLIDRGHRELPIQADYVGHSISTERSTYVDVKLLKTDGEDSVTLPDIP